MILRGFLVLVCLYMIARAISLTAGAEINRSVELSIPGETASPAVVCTSLLERQQLALQIDSVNPEGLRQMGRIQRFCDADAAKTFSRLVALYPASGIAHAELFRTQVLNRVIDEDTHHALEQAVRFGGWEPDVMDLVTDTGTRYWLMLDKPSRTLVLETAVRALTRPAHPDQAITATQLRDRGFLTLVCAAVEEDGLTSPLCRKVP